LVIETKSREETLLLGEKIGKALKNNSIVALIGDLGAGKTTLIQGIAKGLKVDNWVTSPTFTIINEFKGRLDLYHVDLYRIERPEDIEDIALEEYFSKNGVTVIEWADKIKELLPERSIMINMDHISENERKIDIRGLNI